MKSFEIALFGNAKANVTHKGKAFLVKKFNIENLKLQSTRPPNYQFPIPNYPLKNKVRLSDRRGDNS